MDRNLEYRGTALIRLASPLDAVLGNCIMEFAIDINKGVLPTLLSEDVGCSGGPNVTLQIRSVYPHRSEGVTGVPLPEETLSAAQKTEVVLLGAIGGYSRI
ncbi:hypothetical protein F3Y22_tig00111366pilonHSYRG00202 [Hibiscus syriacus]|uniref:Uncharacterized protein n=1 Tax=Hibiscus syriacus TaxID=106335 RepID=A0A6A2YNA2_HIBSY|nr:hypothetical protein F3Y22_tig00111366pilonHSYRG00202 [Hibiscus syriacus]